MKRLQALFVIVTLGTLAFAACAPSSNGGRGGDPAGGKLPGAQVTGKGNGGNPLKMSQEDIKAKIMTMKPALLNVFTGLKSLADSETLVPGMTDLNGKKDLIDLINLMTEKAANKVFEDIQTAANFNIQEGACVDSASQSNAATAIPGEIGGKICFSLDSLQEVSPKDADDAVNILLLAIAAHEFGHHYLTGDKMADEALVQKLQDFVSKQLHKYEAAGTNTISIGALSFADKFRAEAETLFEQAQIAQTLHN